MPGDHKGTELFDCTIFAGITSRSAEGLNSSLIIPGCVPNRYFVRCFFRIITATPYKLIRLVRECHNIPVRLRLGYSPHPE